MEATCNFEDTASLTEEESNSMKAMFEEEELLAAINVRAPNKAPGPCGFTMAFSEIPWALWVYYGIFQKF